jgi:hypothetical protein
MGNARNNRLTPKIERALIIMSNDRIVYRVGNRWFGDSRQVIAENTIYAMFDRRLAFISSTGKRVARHRALLTDIGHAIAKNLFDAGEEKTVSEESSQFIAQVTA